MPALALAPLLGVAASAVGLVQSNRASKAAAGQADAQARAATEAARVQAQQLREQAQQTQLNQELLIARDRQASAAADAQKLNLPETVTVDTSSSASDPVLSSTARRKQARAAFTASADAGAGLNI